MRTITYTSQGNRKTLRFCKNRSLGFKKNTRGRFFLSSRNMMCTLLYQQMSDMPTGISNRPNFVRIVNSLVVWTLSTGLVMWCVCFFLRLLFVSAFLFVFCFVFLFCFFDSYVTYIDARSVSAVAFVLTVSCTIFFFFFQKGA